jgi:hypothetical protein
MPLTIPTTQQLKDNNLANLEGQLGQTSPLADKAFLRVLAAMEALQATGHYKYATERSLQNLALTATGTDLDKLGSEIGIIRKPGEAAILTISLPAITGTVIPAGVDYIGDSNGVRYFPASSVVAAAGVAISTVTAEIIGVNGNLLVGDTMSISSQVPGAETVATVTVIDNIGAETETDEAYRQRVLFGLRTTKGGGNATDHKKWAEEVAGVFKAFPYAGKPIDPPLTDYPSDRTVYIEADTTIDADGIAPGSLLDEVRDSINTDPVTLLSRPGLGFTDSTLFVESIIRTAFIVTITNLVVDAAKEADTKTAISLALDTYFRAIAPFLTGIDLEQERNDFITNLTVSEVVQDILSANGASGEDVSFAVSTAPGTPLANYRLDPGELSKLDSVVYV